VQRKLSWLSNEDLLKRVLSLEFNRLLDYYKDAPTIDVIDEKQAKRDRKERKDNEPRSDKDKDRRTAEKGMARIYVNAGKADGFFAGNLIEIINKVTTGQRVDVGRIDLLSNYSLFDVKKSDAARVVGGLKGAEFFGKRLYSEVADAEKDYAQASKRRNRADKHDDSRSEGRGEGRREHKDRRPKRRKE
jgi:ATP-dependent RNA helicase DeaD